MIIEGRHIAEKIYGELKEQVENFEKTPRLTVFTCAPNFETQKYLHLKKKKADFVGIQLRVVELGVTATTEEVVEAVTQSSNNSDAIIVQLPLPQHIDTETVLASIPVTHDVDALNPGTAKFHSPVVGAIKEILETYAIEVIDQNVLIIGEGKLVGEPAYKWFIKEGANVTKINKSTDDISAYTIQADIIVSGAGVPGLITPSMIKDGAIILDAGTSEDGGELRGDADPACAKKCSIFTPVPGGIGPITIAILLQNTVSTKI